MLVYYSETRCMNREDESYASSGQMIPCIDFGFSDIVFGNNFTVPKGTTRIIIREELDNLIERVFLKYDGFIYPIRTRIFYPSDVVVLIHVNGVNEFTKVSRPNKEIVFARDEALLEAIGCLEGIELCDIADQYNLIAECDPYMNYLDNHGSRMRHSFIGFTDEDDMHYVNLNGYDNVYSPMLRNVSFAEDFNKCNDEPEYKLFNYAFDYCMKTFKHDTGVNELLSNWSHPILPCDITIDDFDNFTLQCANDLLSDRDLRAYRDGVIRTMNSIPVKQVTKFSAKLLDWIRRLLQLPAVQLCFRYILPKWNYELIYKDAFNQTQFNGLITDVLQRGSKVIQELLPSGKYTDVVIDKSPDDVLIIKTLGAKTELLAIDLIVASALDDGFVSLDYPRR